MKIWWRHPRRWNKCVRLAERYRYLAAEHPDCRDLHFTPGQIYTVNWPPKRRR